MLGEGERSVCYNSTIIIVIKYSPWSIDDELEVYECLQDDQLLNILDMVRCQNHNYAQMYIDIENYHHSLIFFLDRTL